jgi:uncharacterized protein YcbX
LSKTARIVSIYRYPVKGFTANRMAGVSLDSGQSLPLDRAYAVEHGSREFDPLAPRPYPKTKFLQLMTNERLACLETRFEEEGHVFTIFRKGRQVARGSLATPLGRTLIGQFLTAYLDRELHGPLRVVHAGGWSFSDAHENLVSMINLETVRDLERLFARPVDPLRFRANIYVEGIPAWTELQWQGPVRIGSMPCLEVAGRIDRCSATNVDPATGARDLHIPRLIEDIFGHHDCGIYLRATDSLALAEGTGLVPSWW